MRGTEETLPLCALHESGKTALSNSSRRVCVCMRVRVHRHRCRRRTTPLSRHVSVSVSVCVCVCVRSHVSWCINHILLHLAVVRELCGAHASAVVFTLLVPVNTPRVIFESLLDLVALGVLALCRQR